MESIYPFRFGSENEYESDRPTRALDGGSNQYKEQPSPSPASKNPTRAAPNPDLPTMQAPKSDQPMAGVDCVRPTKRKAASFSGEEPSPKARRTVVRSGEDKKPHPRGEEETPAPKKMWRLPLEEAVRIVDRSPYGPPVAYQDLKRDNPSLVPSSSSEEDEKTVALYRRAREYYEHAEEFAGFQARVRREYASKGFVEVDYDCVGGEAQAQRRVNQARGEAFRAIVAHLSSEVVVDGATFRQLRSKMMDGF